MTIQSPTRSVIFRPVLLAAVGAAAALFALATRTQADSDLWGHLRFGLDVLRTHRLPGVDPYSFTQDRPWLNHEWFSELQMGVAYAGAGVAGLALLKGALVFGTLACVWFALSGIDPVARLMTIAMVALSTAPLTRTLRPQLWSMLCLAILCRVLVEERRRARRWLPLLFLVWANLHGGWIVGFGILAVWAGVDVLIRPKQFAMWAAVVPLSVLATLATPYGVELWRFLYATVGMSRGITEWQPLWTMTPPNWVPWICTVAVSAWLLRRGELGRFRAVAVSLVLAYASARVSRLWPLYVECAAILLAPRLRSRWPSRKGASSATVRSRQEAVAAGAICAIGLVVATWLMAESLRCVAVSGSWVPDVAAANALDAHRPGRLVVYFDWGEYAIWHWGPDLRVSMDGRRETVYTDARLADHQQILSGTPAGLALLDAWQPEYVWLPATSQRTRDWLASHGYRIEVATAKSFVAVRQDLPRLSVDSPAPARACFPG